MSDTPVAPLVVKEPCCGKFVRDYKNFVAKHKKPMSFALVLLLIVVVVALAMWYRKRLAANKAL